MKVETKIQERHDRSSVTKLVEHIVFTTKYRRKVLAGKVETECERKIRRICKGMDVIIVKMSVQPDHVHLLIQHPPKLSISKIAEKIKTNTSRELRKMFPHLRKQSKKALWSRGYHASSIGHGHDAVERYIEGQGISNHAKSGCDGSIGRLPNAVGKPDYTLNGGIADES